MCLNLELGINNNREPPNHIAVNDNGGKTTLWTKISFIPKMWIDYILILIYA